MKGILEKGDKRDFRREEKTDNMYSYFNNKFDFFKKDIFFYSAKYAFLKNIKGKKLKGKTKHIGQISDINNDTQLEIFGIALYMKYDNKKYIKSIDECLKSVEKLANAGIRLLYKDFQDYDGDKIYLLEEISEELNKSIKN
ncbi:MAG: hypothetical protein ACOCRX_01625 [Candidatus Woesearchaeota archaeon]